MKRIVCVLVALCAVIQPLWGKTAKRKTRESPQVKEFRLRQKLVKKIEKELPGEKGIVEKIFSDPRLGLVPAKLPYPNEEERKKLEEEKKKEKEEKKIHKIRINPFFRKPPGMDMLSEESWRRGKEYMEKYAATFALAEETTGVPKEITASISRAETYVGKGLGDDPASAESYFNRGLGVYPAINTFYTMYIKKRHPKRVNPVKEMACLIKICLENGWDIFAIPGSSAGCVGIPQFIPCSYANPEFVADGDGDGKINLFRHEDSIMSVPKYLKRCGWGDTLASKKRAIFEYNRDHAYVEAILVYGELLGKAEYDKEYVKKFIEPPRRASKLKKRGAVNVQKLSYNRQIKIKELD